MQEQPGRTPRTARQQPPSCSAPRPWPPSSADGPPSPPTSPLPGTQELPDNKSIIGRIHNDNITLSNKYPCWPQLPSPTVTPQLRSTAAWAGSAPSPPVHSLDDRLAAGVGAACIDAVVEDESAGLAVPVQHVRRAPSWPRSSSSPGACRGRGPTTRGCF